jgi:hypothetical protein
VTNTKIEEGILDRAT